MLRFTCLSLVTLLSVSGCGDDAADDDAGAGGMDAATDDAGRPDAGRPDAGRPDAGEPDAGRPDAGPPDAGLPDAGPGTPEGCNPETGIECDGDWTERCEAAGLSCGDDECCSPQRGSFACVARDEDGACPAPDLWVDAERIEPYVEWRFFSESDCALVEGCVTTPGWRRLLRFSTWTPNTGTADLFLGPPSVDVPYFSYSECHDHFHFDTYAAYELRAEDGELVGVGHKQAFCLIDFYQYPGTTGRGAVYDCGNQGIQRDWQDVYGSSLDCQWVDVTDVDPGEYTLHVDLNREHIINETDYSNNTASVTVTVPEDTSADVTTECPGSARSGTGRDCGLVRGGADTCEPGSRITVGCSAMCMQGSCEGDTFIRVCEGSDDPTCTARAALASNDDSGCGERGCGAGGDCCSQLTFTCPDSGEYVVFWGPYNPRRLAETSCTLGDPVVVGSL